MCRTPPCTHAPGPAQPVSCVGVCLSLSPLGLGGSTSRRIKRVFARVYHCAISELCKGLYYRNGVWHGSPRPQIHRFRPQARALPLGAMEQAFLTERCSDGEVSGSGVSEGVCEALTLMEWSTMVVPTYPEGGSHALQVCQHHHQVVRVGRFVGLSETQRTRCSRLLRPIRLTFTVRQRAARSILP